MSLNRRRTLALLGAGGAAALLLRDFETPEADAATCVPSTPTVTEGPYWVDEKLFRSDIRTDPTTGTARPGVPLSLTINVQNDSNGSCVPLTGALVDIWHCDASGIYSDERAYNPGGGTGTVTTTGQKFLRGYQITDDSGQVQFTTIYPGWYGGRTIHVHVRIRTYSGTTLLDNFVTQLFFDDSVSNTVLANAAYKRTTARDTANTNDMVYEGAQNPSRMLLAVTQNGDGYAGAITIGVTMKTASASTPVIAAGGIANAASGAAGLMPGGWISIYGSNLAAATRAMSVSDVVSNILPTSLGGVSVQINGKAAFVYYASSSIVNVLSPADASTGPVNVTVSNSAGTSNAVSATLQAIVPGLFQLSNYVRAVRVSDGAIVDTARSGDVIELYGTGFGSAAGAPEAGVVFSGAYRTDNVVSVSIGSVPADVSFAGLVAPGLYQINVTVPGGLASGDQPVIAKVSGISSAAGALLKIAG